MILGLEEGDFGSKNETREGDGRWDSGEKS